MKAHRSLETAYQLLLKGSPRTAQQLERIQKWDETKTVRENTLRLAYKGVPIAAQFARRFGLRYVRKNSRKARPVDLLVVRRLQKAGFTLSTIGQLYGRSRQKMDQMLHATRKGKVTA